MAPLRSTLGKSLGRLLKVGRSEDLAGTGAQGGAALSTQLNSKFYGGREGNLASEATGGTEVVIGSSTYHIFLNGSPEPFVIDNRTMTNVEFLLIVGGGGV